MHPACADSEKIAYRLLFAGAYYSKEMQEFRTLKHNKMEHHYTAYTKKINDVEFYFVKKYTCYPEIKNTPSLLDSYGMHTNFTKACKIARVNDPELMQRLFKEANAGSIYRTIQLPLHFQQAIG